jgi:hypothetical protein
LVAQRSPWVAGLDGVFQTSAPRGGWVERAQTFCHVTGALTFIVSPLPLPSVITSLATENMDSARQSTVSPLPLPIVIVVGLVVAATQNHRRRSPA